ncbi:MAG TPA: S41 family peptidase [Vicinamibacterales bacterium]|jgi:carboxyl-terminal processing protease|nr:S41 family peptidase [Vicinamibacterales bacterium]
MNQILVALALAAGMAAGSIFDAAWAIVRDTHFDPTFNGVDWNQVRTDLRPRAETAQTPEELRAAIEAMLARLGQSHFALVPAAAGGEFADLSGSPGFDFRLTDRDAIVVAVDATGPAAGLVGPGWSIGTVDGASIEAILGGISAGSASPMVRFEAWRRVTAKTRGPVGASVAIKFTDTQGAEHAVSIRREPEPGQRVQVGNLPTLTVRTSVRAVPTPSGRTAGLIHFNVWMAPVDGFVQAAVDRFRNAAGIILDLRGNPGGLAMMVMGISGHFVDEPVLLGRMKTRETELRLSANPRRVNAAGAPVKPYAGPLAILVDDLTGSASECFAGGLQAISRGRVFGTRTMGQALPATFSRLPNGDTLVHAFGDFVTAAGVRLEGRGVVPDVEIPIDRKALAAGRDPALEAALRWIDDLRPGRGL